MIAGARRHVAAKGVATIAQLQFLREETCDFVRGFLFSPPVGAARFSKRLHSYDPEYPDPARIADRSIAARRRHGIRRQLVLSAVTP
jgi:hypothetical protein